jgi:hypothetical protein
MGQQTSRGESDERECGIVMDNNTYKGSGLVWLRKVLTDEQKHKLISELTTDEYVLLTQCLPSSWLDENVVAEIFLKAAQFFDLDQTIGLRKIGHDMAIDQLSRNGFYRFLVHVVSADFMITQAASFWNTFHNNGKAYVERTGERSGIFHVVGCPKLSKAVGETVAGYLMGTLESVVDKKFYVRVRVSYLPTNPNDLQWPSTW